MNVEQDTFFNSKTKNIRHLVVNGITKCLTPKLYDDLHYGKYDHCYGFSVPQLIFICECIEKTRNVKGDIAEIGCNEGRTTIFLNKYMDAQKIEKKYYALDTFSGFTAGDIQFEVSNRQKESSQYTGLKASKAVFEIAMNRNNIRRVIPIQADVNEYDLTSLGCLSFALLDVDLYRPMKKSLKELYKALTPGGLIIVDDCDAENEYWDGSDQAYKEFMKEINQPVQIVLGKLGVLSK